MDWLTREYTKRTGHVFRDPDRQIRKLHQEGYLVKVNTGIYKYDPNPKQPLGNFTPEQKTEIMRLGNYKCAVCGKGKKDGVTLHIDHLKPRDKGGEATVENGQVLCSTHNFRKKNYNQTETAKQLFINLFERSRKHNDSIMMDFCTDILTVYDKHDINGHIEWKTPKYK